MNSEILEAVVTLLDDNEKEELNQKLRKINRLERDTVIPGQWPRNYTQITKKNACDILGFNYSVNANDPEMNAVLYLILW